MPPNANVPQPNVPQPAAPQALPTPPQPAPQPQAVSQAPAPTAQPAPQEPAPQPAPQPQAVQQTPNVQIAPAPQPAPQAPQPSSTPTPSATPDYDRMLDAYLGNNNQPANLPSVPTTDDTAEIEKFFNDFATQVEQRAAQRTLAQMRQLDADKAAEQQAWNQVFEKYPQAQNPQQRNILHNLRLGAMVSGSDADLVKIADAFFEPQTTQYQQGYQAANQTTYTQRAQHLTASNSSTPPQHVAKETAYENMAKGGSEGTQAAMLHVQALIDSGQL